MWNIRSARTFIWHLLEGLERNNAWQQPDIAEGKCNLGYKILLHGKTLQKVKDYQEDLERGDAEAGSYLKQPLSGMDISNLGTSDIIECLLRTKKPQIFAESAVYGDGSDWSQKELSILGDISIAVPVTMYDDGRHSAPMVHLKPFPGTLLYVPGALLRNGCGITPADWDMLIKGGQIDPHRYYQLYERRLLPAFLYADHLAISNNQQALITIPGLGCGQFAGQFRGQLGEQLRKTLIQILENYQDRLPNVRAVYYDPYRECQNERHEIGHLSFMVHPLVKGNAGKPQLCEPRTYQENNDDFSNCALFSLVAWDHVSWPGNDFYIGSRATDDGVKAAATSSMAQMTGVEGVYHQNNNTYDPPSAYWDWADVVRKNGIQLHVKDNLIVAPSL